MKSASLSSGAVAVKLTRRLNDAQRAGESVLAQVVGEWELTEVDPSGRNADAVDEFLLLLGANESA